MSSPARRALVVLERDVGERLEPRAEAALRLADALRDRSEPAVLARVEMQHPVGPPNRIERSTTASVFSERGMRRV